MQRATGFGKPPPVPWRQRIRSGPPDAGIRRAPGGRRSSWPRSPSRSSLSSSMASSCIGWHRPKAPCISGVPRIRAGPQHDPDFRPSRELHEALQNVFQTGFAELKVPKPAPDTVRLRPDERNPRASSSSEGSGSVSTGSTSQTTSTSTGSSASGGGSTGSGSTDSGSGSSDSGSGSTDSGSGSTDSGGPGGGGGDTGGGGSGGGDTGGGTGGGGGGGGGLTAVLDRLVDLISG